MAQDRVAIQMKDHVAGLAVAQDHHGGFEGAAFQILGRPREFLNRLDGRVVDLQDDVFRTQVGDVGLRAFLHADHAHPLGTVGDDDPSEEGGQLSSVSNR